MRLAEIPGRLRGASSTVTFVDDKGAATTRTFDQLHADVRALSAALQTLGVGPGCRVGISAPSHYAWMVWDLACIERGCVSVAFPNERPSRPLVDLLSAYELSLLAVQPEWIDEQAVGDARVVDVLTLAPHTAPGIAPVVVQHAAGTHSLVFSSGTTGKTKGLVISAPGTENLLNLYHDAFGVVAGERFLTFLPLANYQQRMVYYFCLYHGVDFVSVPFAALFAGLKAHSPTFVIAPPVLYETLQSLACAGVPATGPQGQRDREAVSRRLAELTGGRIRYMITGMAPIKRAALDFFWNHGIELYEAFGITEAGMVAWNKPGQVRVGTVGRPAEAGSVSLADDGEVIVTREALLSLGYFESSEEDARNTFIGQGRVATGDIAEFDQDGFLTVVGRKKDAIITRNGEKFHPEPIENLLYGDARVRVAVVMMSDRRGLCAVISLPQADDEQVQQTLRTHVAAVNDQLPSHQQLRHLVFTTRDFTVDNGLRTRNLKLNRKAILQEFLPEG